MTGNRHKTFHLGQKIDQFFTSLFLNPREQCSCFLFSLDNDDGQVIQKILTLRKIIGSATKVKNLFLEIGIKNAFIADRLKNIRRGTL